MFQVNKNNIMGLYEKLSKRLKNLFFIEGICVEI